MSNWKKIGVILFSLIFGTIFMMAVSLVTVYLTGNAVSANTTTESHQIEAAGAKKIQLTVELGKVMLVPESSDKITIKCQYPAEGFLNNEVRVIEDRDHEELSVRLTSKQKIYFFGLIKDKSCNITIGIPINLYPILSIKQQAGTLTVDGPELTELAIDGDIAEIEIRDLGTQKLKKVSVRNNVGNVTAYLDNLADKTQADFEASVNIGLVDLHLKTEETRGYQLHYAYNIGKLSMQGKNNSGFGKSESLSFGSEQSAVYRLKTDVGEIRVFEERISAN